MNIKRVTLSSDVEEVKFPNVCGKWLVKNFGENDAFVSFEENAQSNEKVKIPSGFGQVIVDNEYLGGLDVFKHDTIYLSGTSGDEVEVQQLCFH